MRKKLTFLVLAVMLTALFVPLAQAQVYTIWAYSGSTIAYYNVLAVHPSTNSSLSGIAQSFNASETAYLSRVRVWAKTTNTEFTGTLVCRLHSLSGGYGSGGYPSSTILATSDTVNVEDISAVSFAYVDFNFDATYQVQDNSAYIVSIVLVTTSGAGGDDWVYFGLNTVAADTAETFTYTSGAWGEVDENYMMMWTISGTGTAGTSETIDEGTTLSFFASDWMIWIIVLSTMLIPMALMFFLMRGRLSKWIVLIALAIGVSLGYVMFPTYVPIWMVFLVAIGLIGFAYSDVRREA